MKTILIGFGLLLSSASFGQTQEFGRWKIGSSISYDIQLDGTIYGDFITPSTKNGILPGGCYSEPNYEPAKGGLGIRDINFSTGIVGQYAITRKLEIGTGVTYSRKSVIYNYFSYESFALYCGNQSFTYAPIPLNYLEIPLFARYNFLKTKLNFHIESGVTTGMILNEYTYGQSKFSMSAQAGLGMSYTISNLINISATAFYERKVLNFDRSVSIYAPKSASFELRAAYIF